jgi:hypothetical protein
MFRATPHMTEPTTRAALLAPILFRLTSVLVALTLVPIVAALIGGFGSQVGTFAMEGIRNTRPSTPDDPVRVRGHAIMTIAAIATGAIAP